MNGPVVNVEELHVQYSMASGVLPVLDIEHFQVHEKEHIALAGPSGSGKSTLLHVLAGLLVPEKGKVMVCGEAISSMNEKERDQFRARHIGYVFQNFNLLQSHSAQENVLVGMTMAGMHADKKRAADLLAQLGLKDRLKHLPATLSAGEQQRVAIARALIKRPTLVLADEPTGSLDPVRTKEVIHQFISLCGEHGITLLLVSHDPEVIQSFPRSISFMSLNRVFQNPGGKG